MKLSSNHWEKIAKYVLDKWNISHVVMGGTGYIDLETFKDVLEKLLEEMNKIYDSFCSYKHES